MQRDTRFDTAGRDCSARVLGRATWRRLPILTCALVTSGCSPSQVPVQVDVPVVLSRTPAWKAGEAWRIAEAPELELPHAGIGEEALGSVLDAEREHDGRVLVANGTTREVLFFDSLGKPVGSIGGVGAVRFRSVARVEQIGDGVTMVNDWLSGRTSFFRPNGEVLSSYVVASDTGGMPTLVAVRPDGAAVFAVLPVVHGRHTHTRVTRGTVALRLYNPQGKGVRALGETPGEETYVEVTGWRSMAISPLFGPTSLEAVSRDRVYVGDNATGEISVRDMKGRLLHVVGTSRPLRKVTPRMRADAVEARLKPITDLAQRAIVARLLSKAPAHARLPAFSELQVDDQENLWLREYTVPGQRTAEWNVYSPQGVWLGPVGLPATLQVTRIRDGRVVGIRSDSTSAQSVQVFRILKPRGSETVGRKSSQCRDTCVHPHRIRHS